MSFRGTNSLNKDSYHGSCNGYIQIIAVLQ